MNDEAKIIEQKVKNMSTELENMEPEQSHLTTDYRPQLLTQEDWYAIVNLLKYNDYRAVLECISCFARCNAELDPEHPNMREDVLIRGGIESVLNVLYGQGQTYEHSSAEDKLYPFTVTTNKEVRELTDLAISEYEALAAKSKPQLM